MEDSTIAKAVEDFMATASKPMPLTPTHADLSRIVSTPCGSETSPSSDSPVTAAAGEDMGPDNATLLQDLKIKISEAHNTANSLMDEVYERWTASVASYLSRLSNFIRNRLTVTIDNKNSLSDQQKELLRIILQTSNFVLFLETEKDQAAYGLKQSSLSDLKGRLVQVTCAARPLLGMSDSELQGHVTTHIRHSLRVNEGIRRIVCAVTLKVMADFLNSVNI